jgi:hypothetical protein
LTDISPEDAARDQARTEGVLELAQRLRLVSDTDPARPHPLDETLAEGEEGNARAFRTWSATHAVAERLGMAIYSDDRVVRLVARRAGIPAFGTVALLDVLVDHDLVNADLRAAARRRLWASGVSGLVPSAGELTDAGRRSSWDLDESTAAMLLDPVAWRAAPAEANRRALFFLAAVSNESPDLMPRWVMRVLRTAYEAAGGKVGMIKHAQALVILAWEPFDDAGVPFLRALVRSVRAAGRVLGFDDPLPGAVRFLDEVGRQAVPELATVLRWSVLRQVEAADALRLVFGEGFGRLG